MMRVAIEGAFHVGRKDGKHLVSVAPMVTRIEIVFVVASSSGVHQIHKLWYRELRDARKW